MVTEFQLMDAAGKVIANGEIDGEVYRAFSSESSTDCEEFETLEDMYAKCGGVAIQPMMFETHARTRQISMFRKKE